MRLFKSVLSVSENRKGVLDIDTVKGCSIGMSNYPEKGCYGLCYAQRLSRCRGIDFSTSVSRKINKHDKKTIQQVVKRHPAKWFRIGTMGDPSHDWELTLSVCEWLGRAKIPVIVTKHWVAMTDTQIERLKKCGVIINTSISALDNSDEIHHRLAQFYRLQEKNVGSILRIVSAKFGDTEWGSRRAKVQDYLFSLSPTIDNPLRIPFSDKRVIDGDIIVERHDDLGGGSTISIANRSAYIGRCDKCQDQCGVNLIKGVVMNRNPQIELFPTTKEFIHVKSVIGSGYEDDVAKLAIEDKVAYRAARKNMQIHSAIILKLNDVFSGFFTFQVNHDAKEFCLLQSAMTPGKENKETYSEMVSKIIEQNTFGYPMIMTVSTKHPLECPKVFEAIGFKTYLDLSGYAYMVYGTMEQIRLKRLAHATMTNAWTTTRADWLKMKKEWNGKIEEAGEKHGVKNPKFASRDGCWQGKNGMSNVVLATQKIEGGEIVNSKEKSLNGNASVLDPVACEVILRFFMPTAGRRVYNPFGGGVQFGFVSGSYGYDYVASEIRQNQCDANNLICSDLNSAKWVQSDSSTHSPEGMFDLVFSCPPYYKVEEYIDYDGVIPEGELNNLPSYNVFRETLFAGYKKAIEKLNDNCFFVVMTGDSRNKDGAYYGCEAEHELFFRDQGLHIYNKIVYLECEFTRLAHAKITLNYRKFPKREQKILVFYKGNIGKIKELYPPMGRL